ncbi:uncharacterized protein LOC143880804 [Tasmannia lanceolata]|uniref:uncharacterized protein LOC143880804 n=1 Tax=Tasmannia lanceolata TaxID=3420 RepID=UPI00406338C4
MPELAEFNVELSVESVNTSLESNTMPAVGYSILDVTNTMNEMKDSFTYIPVSVSPVSISKWLANIVPVPKKDGKVRMCVDFRDLNKASPKDDFPLPNIDLLIKMAPEDMIKTAFTTQWGTYCYRQDSGSKKERPVYYISKKMLEYEVKYTILEKTCLALVWATQRLRHYLLSSKVLLLSRMDPLKYLFEKPALTGRTARWLLLLSEFDITYVTQKSVKGRVIAEHLADSPVEESAFLKAEFPDEEIMDIEEDTPNTRWTMYFDGAVNNQGQGIGAVLIQDIDVFGDSILIIYQTNGKWKTREDRLIPYNAYLESLVQKFRSITFTHLYRTKNHFADALATLASMLDISATMEVQPLTVRLQWEPAHVTVIEIAARCPDGKPWYTDIRNLISGEGHPPGASGKERKTLQKLAANFVICGGQLYRRSFDGIQLLCVDEDKAVELIEQTHEGVLWGIDIIGKVHPKSSSGHEYILVAIDYFTKWIEAASYASITSNTVAKFIRANIICRYGVPHELISDNVYGMEAVLPVELRIPSLRVMIEASLPESEWVKARHQELQMIDEKRLRALYHIQGYQRRIERAFNKKVRVRDLKPGDLVLKSYRAPVKVRSLRSSLAFTSLEAGAINFKSKKLHLLRKEPNRAEFRRGNFSSLLGMLSRSAGGRML